MNLKELEALGGLVTEALIEKEITFRLDDDTQHKATVFVKKMGLGEYEKTYVKDEKFGVSARLISECVFLGDGKERIPVEKAYRLHRGLANALLDVIAEVNRGKKA